ncbi:NAD(P)-dependent dehydrogenase, short-chain alcohol dehydrogenase family [Belliella buryatensis]|uniref:NAD(P)-dependent dehydrogenase, short-chain alcohol dehydrogenase family n=1 Tax=Belliella buryatensis TaxID=1500549 RepID=A0A239EZG6_9BACT|nr:SDR family oxidoreductase [Belliella buryatensis]SNS49851.1 NAD(P)-dependent dehydrogenase, short-chain alcohol dehydrogenase family [Belliella buryatensis]
MTLKGKTAIITGGSGGIGLATAKTFLEMGVAAVMLVDLREEDLKAAKQTLNSDLVYTFAADVSQASQVEAYTKAAVEKMGPIDILFLNAGIEGVVKPLTEYPEEMFDKVIAVNVKGVWLGMKYGFPEMKNGGAVIITSSVAGMVGTAQMMAYTTSKHATIGAMKVGALEGAPLKIRVNSVHPSPVDNRMMRSLEDGFAPGAGAEVKKSFEQMIPLGRYADNQDIADLVAFLASDQSKFITGATYVIDGGFTT